MTTSQFEVADVFRAGFDNYRQAHGPLPKEHYDVANAIMSCHTAKSGGHVFRCADCGHDLISYNSCRNRHCPSCQGAARAKWVENRVKELLPVPYFMQCLQYHRNLILLYFEIKSVATQCCLKLFLRHY